MTIGKTQSTLPPVGLKKPVEKSPQNPHQAGDSVQLNWREGLGDFGFKAGALLVSVPATLAGLGASMTVGDGSLIGPLFYLCCGPAVGVIWASGLAGGAVGGGLGYALGWTIDKSCELVGAIKDKLTQ